MNFSEYLVEYDNDNNVVYISGLDQDVFWIEIECQTDIADPESYAWGRHEAYKSMGITSQVLDITGLDDDEEWEID